MTFDYLSIAYIVLLVVFFIIGCCKGLFKSVLRLCRTIGSVIVAAFLSKPISSWFVNSKMAQDTVNKLADTLVAKNEAFGEVYNHVYFDQLFSSVPIVQLDPVKKLIYEIIEKLGFEGTDSAALVVSRAVVYYAIMAICFVVILLIIGLVVSILIKVFGKIENNFGGIKFTNRLLGGVLYLLVAAIIICAFSYALNYAIVKEWSISTWFASQLHLDETGVKTLSKFFYEKNYLVSIIAFIQGLLIK